MNLRAITGHRDTDSRTDTELLSATPLDPEAFGVFYDRHFEQLIRFFWQRTRDREPSADLTSETFAAALAGLPKYDPTRGDPAQWLYGIANNQLKKFWRHQTASTKARKRLGITTPETPTTGWSSIERADTRLDRERLHAALERVPRKNREAVRLRSIDELDYDTIATRLGCTSGAARVRVLRGLKQLHHEFNKPNNNG